VPTGLTLRQLSNTGDTTKGAPLTNAEVDQNLVNLRNAATVTVLDDITSQFDGVTTTFPLTANAVAVYAGSPHALMISLISMLLQPYIVNTYEQYVWQQEVSATVSSGNYTITDSNITFVDAPLTTQKFYGRLLGSYVSDVNTAIRNVFTPVPIVLS
jgi:hypothetical protein